MCTDSDRKIETNTSPREPNKELEERKRSKEETRTTGERDIAVVEETAIEPKGQTEQIFEIVYINNGDRRPYALVEVRGVKRYGLLDTGAQSSVISEDWLEEMHLWSDELVPTERIIATVDATRHAPKGKLYVDFTFNEEKATIPVLVGPIGKKRLILGIDFMMTYGIKLDIPRQKYSMTCSPEVRQAAIEYIEALEEEERRNRDRKASLEREKEELEVDEVDELMEMMDSLPDESGLLNSEDVPKTSFPVTCPHELTPEQQKELEEVISLFQPTPEEGPLNHTTAITHNIDTGTAKPIFGRVYPIAPKMVKLAKKEIQRMLKRGIIRKIEYSPWRQPALIVGKKDGTGRICLDARQLNKITVANAFPIIDVNQILARIKYAKYLTSIDLSQAFFQILLDAMSQLKTAFVFDNQLYCYNRMTMGLKGSPATLAVLVDRIFHDLAPQAFAYADDFIICSETFEEHMKILRTIAERLRAVNLTISQSKSHFACKQLEFLGYILNQDGLRANPEKITPVVEFPQPTTVKAMQRFLGMCGWYRRFIRDFARMSAPLYDLLKTKDKSIGWSEAADAGFKELKAALTSAPILSMCDYGRPFKIWCDASLLAAGAILTQEFELEEDKTQKIDKVIAYFSAKFSPQERNYSATERECLAMIWSIEKFRVYVEGGPFTVITDHSALKWLMTTKDLRGRLARWAMRLQPFISDMTIEHRAGKEMQFPDALSRAYDVAELTSTLEEEIQETAIELIDVKIDNTKDKWYARIRSQVEGKGLERYKIEGDLLYHQSKFTPYAAERSWVLCVPGEKREEVLSEQHDQMSHMGVWRTYKRMKTMYYWPNMCEDVHKYIRKCKICTLAKPSNEDTAAPIGKYRDPIMPGRALSIDFTGPLPMTRGKNRFIFVAIDCFSRYVYVKPMKIASAEAVVAYLENEVFPYNGCPEWIISDNGKQFRSRIFEEFCKRNKIRAETTPKGHPQANQVESTNKSIKTALRTYAEVQADQTRWDEYLKKIIIEQNATPHTSTGQTPNMLHFGREITRKGDEFEKLYDVNPNFTTSQEAKELVRDEAKGTAQNQYDDRREKYNTRVKLRTFHENQQVFVANWKLSSAGDKYSAKLANKKVEAYVSKRIGNDTYLLMDRNQKPIGKYHASKMMTR